MDSHGVILQGSRYPIYIAVKNGKAPSGYKQVNANTSDSAKNQIAEFGPALTSDIAKRLELINLLQMGGLTCPRHASARETASILIKGLMAGSLLCYHQQPKTVLQVSDNTASSSSKKGGASSNNGKGSTTSASGKKASEAKANNGGSAANSSASETPITEQECRSDPVSMLTGEEILPLIDFTLAGNKNLIWRRLYRSSHCQHKSLMGNGWRHDFMANLTEHFQPAPKVGPKRKGTYWLIYQDEHGANHRFEKVKPGQSSYQLSSNLALHYQTNGKQVLITPDDQHLTFKPGESSWLLEKIINEKGQSLHFVYDAKERLHRIEVNKKRGCILQYNKQNLLEKVTAYIVDTNNKSYQKRILLSPLLAEYQFDDNANLIQATNQQGETEHYHYNAAHLLIKRTRASGFSHHFEWDSYSTDAKCIKQWGDNNTYCYQFSYDNERGITTSTDSLDNSESFTHNTQGKLTEHTDANGSTRHYRYNEQGQKIQEIDPQTNKTDFDYNENGQLSCVTKPDGSKTQFAYNQLGQCVLTTLPNNTTIARKYSVTGLLQSETQPDGRTALYNYNEQGQLAQQVDVNGQITQYNWNEQGELLAKQHNDELIRYSYDVLGRLNATINNAGLLNQYKYNAHGQLIEATASNENTVLNESSPEKQHHFFEYDQAGRLVATKNSKGHITEQKFAGLSQPQSIVQPDGSALHLTYDNERNLTVIERGDGAHYRISYDANENATNTSGFDNKEQRYQYDGNNNLTSVNESNKRIVNIKRDALGRVKSQQASVALNESDIVNNQNYYRYNVMGKITQAHNAQATIKQSFDNGGRLLRSEQGLSQRHNVTYTYDLQGRRQTLTLPDNKVLHYTYNALCQLSGMALTLAANSADVSADIMLAEFEYDSQDNITTQRMGNQSLLTQQFDVFNRLTEQNLTHPNQQIYDNCSYQYDSENQLITQVSQINQVKQTRETLGEQLEADKPLEQTKQFAYNSLGQLTREAVHSGKATATKEFQWDSFGNPLIQQATTQSTTQGAEQTVEQIIGQVAEGLEAEISKSYIEATTEGDRLTQFADIDYRYDALGNQIAETGQGVKNSRAFNAFNQLIRFTNNGTLPNNTITEYSYDPFGRRVAKHTERSRIDYIWDGDQLLGEYQQGQYTWYINLPNQFYPVALIKSSDDIFYYHVDQLNTPRFVTNANAEVVWESKTDAYGYAQSDLSQNELARNELTRNELAEKQTVEFFQPIRFQGQYFDEESGFHYNRYRYYSPKQQRFIHQDPIGLVGGLNHYQYAPNPVNWVDPMGLSCKEDPDSGFGIMDGIHATLDTAGLAPGVGIIPDALNALIYLVEGDMVNAGFSGGAMIPLAGQAVTATKYGAKAVDAASGAVVAAKKTAIKVAKHIDPKLDKHLKDVADYKKHYEKRLAESIKKGDPARRQGAFKAKITEAKGELGASMYMQKNLSKPPPPATMEMGFGPGPGLDQVWAKRDKDGKVLEYFVVEAKGPGAKLSTGAKKGDQMTEPWIKSNLKSMENSKKYKEKNQLGEDILDAIKNEDPKVTKLVIEAVETNGKIIGGKLQPVPKG